MYFFSYFLTKFYFELIFFIILFTVLIDLTFRLFSIFPRSTSISCSCYNPYFLILFLIQLIISAPKMMKFIPNTAIKVYTIFYKHYYNNYSNSGLAKYFRNNTKFNKLNTKFSKHSTTNSSFFLKQLLKI